MLVELRARFVREAAEAMSGLPDTGIVCPGFGHLFAISPTTCSPIAFSVTPDICARIDGEPDVARLESWLEAAVTAPSIGDVFRDD